MPGENTAHLRTDGAYPFIAVSPSNDWDVQVGFDRACWLRCHQPISGFVNMRHTLDLVPAWNNVDTTPNAVRFGDKITQPDGESIAYPIDSALTTNASAAADDFAPCISCRILLGAPVINDLHVCPFVECAY